MRDLIAYLFGFDQEERAARAAMPLPSDWARFGIAVLIVEVVALLVAVIVNVTGHLLGAW